MIPKNLGTALITAGLMSVAQAALVTRSAVIDFDGLTPATVGGNAGAVVTTQFSGFGLGFTDHNEVRCSQTTSPTCTARQLFGPPPAVSSPNFLMNSGVGTGFSINVLGGYSLSRLVLDYAANRNPFSIKFFDAANSSITGLGLDLSSGTDHVWFTSALVGVNSAVRRIEFGGINSSFAIDNLRFDYVVDSANVPEPAVLGLVALALAGVALSRRRKG